MQSETQLLEAAQPALKHIQPTFDKLWAQGKEYTVLGKKHALHAYAISKTKSQKTWKEAKPRIDKTWKDVKVDFLSSRSNAFACL